MSNVCEYQALRPLTRARVAHVLALYIAAPAAVFILLGGVASACHAAGASAGPDSASNAELDVEGRKWAPCAAEYGTCRFSGTRDVLYGTVEHHVIKTFSNSADCNNGVFGDPAPGVEKRCAVALAATKAVAATPANQNAVPDTGGALPAALKAPPGPGLRCAAPSSQARAPANGDLLEADTPSDGTRLFSTDKPLSLT